MMDRNSVLMLVGLCLIAGLVNFFAGATMAMTAVGLLMMYFIINRLVVERNNPYAFTQYFDRTLVNVKMYEVTPASYNDQVSKPIIQFRGIGKYGNEGLYFRNLFPVNKDFLIRAEPGFYHFYYKSGGQRCVVPMLLTVFYSDGIVDEHEMEESEEVYAKGHEPSADEVKHAVIDPTAKEDAVKKRKESFTRLGFLIPARDQLEIMTDNFIDNFLTRQQSIALMVMNNLDILTKAIVPIGLFAIMALAMLSIAITFASDIVNKAVAHAPVCQPASVSPPPPADAAGAQSSNTETTKGGVFQGIIPGVSGG